MFRRETIIALRARHEAYRIATEILHPYEEVPRPPEPALPIDPPDFSPHRRVLDPMTLITLAVIWGMVALRWFLYWLYAAR